MRYVDIMMLEDDEFVRVGRVWEDGGFQGRPQVARAVEESALLDPETGQRATRGPAFLNAVEGSFNSGYIVTRRGEGDGR
jgi:hypothetical protein